MTAQKQQNLQKELGELDLELERVKKLTATIPDLVKRKMQVLKELGYTKYKQMYEQQYCIVRASNVTSKCQRSALNHSSIFNFKFNNNMKQAKLIFGVLGITLITNMSIFLGIVIYM